VPERVLGQVPERVLGQVPERAPVPVPVPEQARALGPERVLVQVPGQVHPGLVPVPERGLARQGLVPVQASLHRRRPVLVQEPVRARQGLRLRQRSGPSPHRWPDRPLPSW
jgi:hypothetical protein